MTDIPSKPPFAWSCDQIARYRESEPRYQQYARTLREVLEQVVRQLAPLAIVQTRPKSVASFAEKIQRKWPRITDPINQFTDLCGGRVITFTQPEVKAVCEFILQHFEIDWENSVDVSQRLKPAEFGYRSVHDIVTFRPGVFPNEACRRNHPRRGARPEGGDPGAHLVGACLGRVRPRSGLQERLWLRPQAALWYNML